MTNLVHIDDLTFDADASYGERWVCSGLKGWYSGPPMRADTELRSNADGAFGSVKNFRGARVLTFTGYLLGTSVVETQEELMDAFAAIQADGTPISVSVENDSGTRTVTATLSGSPEIEPHNKWLGATVTAQFIADDPVKYGPASTVATGLPTAGGGLEYELGEPSGALYYGALGNLGRVSLTNSGTAESWPSFVVTGELTNGFFIQALESGKVLRYDRVVPAGTTVEIDSRTGAVTVDGDSDASTYLTRDEWFSVGPGETVTVQLNAISGSSGTPTMSAEFAEGYW